MRIRASSSGFTSANRSKKGPNTVEKSASVPPISTSVLCTELCARSHHSGRGVDGFADEAILHGLGQGDGRSRKAFPVLA